ncbi:hypothetical protein BV898_03421 [Hypsibius exemplaris]|uniref:Uncharacterized protein n=1 Tax=Hypsibius exemplaris TaxID=2072580 RepID=A0A1W0X500_HYPEX|nr:hypothetical protein BV898_03421 [Hypsibius exemplaris]
MLLVSVRAFSASTVPAAFVDPLLGAAHLRSWKLRLREPGNFAGEGCECRRSSPSGLYRGSAHRYRVPRPPK